MSKIDPISSKLRMLPENKRMPLNDSSRSLHMGIMCLMNISYNDISFQKMNKNL